MNLRNKKGSISIFVLVGLLFMTAFLIILFSSNVNKSKVVQEQFNIISGIYLPNEDEQSYEDAYTALRKKNKQTLTYDSEKEGLTTVSSIELTKTFEETVSNYRIYGNSIQDGIPSEETPVDIVSLGEGAAIKLINRGKNYINENANWTATTVNQTFVDGVWTFENTDTHEGRYLYYYLTLKPGTYTYSVEGISSQITIKDRSTSKTLVSFNSGSIRSATFTISEVTDIQITGGYVNKASTITMTHVQLEEGSEVTDFEPYEKSSIIIELEEPLKKVGDKADYIDFKTGQIVRNIGKIESYNGETINAEYMSTTGVLTTGATVYYQLDNPTYEYITLQSIQFNEDLTKIEIKSNIEPSRLELEYTGYTLD